MQSEDRKIQTLQRLLLEEDREDIIALKNEIKALRSLIESEKEFDEVISPIISKHLKTYTLEMPDKLGPSITKTLKYEIENSTHTIVDALYPIIGKLIKRYIQTEFQKLSDKINKQVDERFSFKALKRKFRSLFFGVKEEDIIISKLSETQIQQIFIIEKHSGLLRGNYSTANTIDKDVLSGMLTAIKSFVEDALKTGGDQLEVIEYGMYKIYIQNFETYYIAVVLHGIFDSQFKEDLEEKLYDFSEKHFKSSLSNDDISKSLETMFANENS